MTEEEWNSRDHSLGMLAFLSRIASDRKLRLALCSFCRVMWSENWPVSSRRAVEAGERFADGRISALEMNRVQSKAVEVEITARAQGRRAFEIPVRGGPHERRLRLAARCVWPRIQIYRFDTLPDLEIVVIDPDLRQQSAPLLRCIFGNPFRAVVFDPRWRSETAVALAAGIYEERAFDRLPILADALEEAGCDAAEVLSHCRGPGPHARGCWLVDGVLGKE